MKALALLEEPATDLSGLHDGTPPAACPLAVVRPSPFWPETTPIAGLTPVLEPEEAPRAD